jgi:transcriptional regulator with XRE-family HTH domain
VSRRIPTEAVFEAWDKDPAVRAEPAALGDEVTLAAALIRARGAAGMTQEQVARAMGTSQEAIARLESGRSLPSTRTLRRFARATGMRLRIRFEPRPADDREPRASGRTRRDT